jgi:glycerol uptake facilitator-like aquaporin
MPADLPPCEHRPHAARQHLQRIMGHVTDISRRLAAETLGSAILVATVVGSGVMAERLTDIPALALLANALATAAALIVLVTVLRPISGAHFNPAVTVAAALTRGLSPPVAAAYVAAQVVGAMAGTALAHLMFDLPVAQLSQHVRTGGGQWLGEVVATAGLVLVINLAAKRQPAAVPALVGLYIGAAYWFTSSTSFANPAVTLARAFSDTFSGIALADVPAFIVAQLVGAAIGVVLARWLQPAAEAAA